MRHSRPVIAFVLNWLAFVALCAAEDPPRGASAPPGPIVIQNLNIGHIDNLTINVHGGPGGLEMPSAVPEAPAVPAAPVAPAASAAARREFELRFLPDTDLDMDESPQQTGLEIYVFELGQADATLVLGPPDTAGKRRSLLIDMGESGGDVQPDYVKVAGITEALLGEKHLNYFVATHFHADHLGGSHNGIAGLIQNAEFQIDTVIDVGDEAKEYVESGPRGTYDKYEQTMSNVVGSQVSTRVKPQFGAGQIDLGTGVTVEILAYAGKVSAADAGVF
jgi:hypothetical protein